MARRDVNSTFTDRREWLTPEKETNPLYFRYIFAYSFGMAFFTKSRKILVVLCKRCHRDVPAGVSEVPKHYAAVTCILCREARLYLPTEVGLGYPHTDVYKRVK